MVVLSSSFAVVSASKPSDLSVETDVYIALSASCEVPPIGPIALVLLDVLFL